LTVIKAWDLETSTKEEYKRVANPFSPDNYIVANAYCVVKLPDQGMQKRGARVFSEYYPDAAGVDADNDAKIAACKRKMQGPWFTDLLAGTKILAGHNIKFDVLYALANPNLGEWREKNRAAWMKWVANGGIIWDTQLAEYCLRGQAQEAHMLDLGSTAIEHGGNAKLDEVKKLWESGVDTIDIAKDLLMKYLNGYDDGDNFEYGDIGNTELIFRSQYKMATKSGQLRSIILNMGALIYTIECELNGMYVNQELAKKLAEKTANELAEKLVEVNGYIPELPEHLEFNWNSRFHKSALIFGGKVKYDAPAPVLDDEGNFTYYQKKELHYIVKLADGSDGTMSVEQYEKEHAEFGDDCGVTLVKFAGGKNKGEPKTKQVTVADKERGPKTRIEPHYFEFPGYTKPDKKWESDADPGVYSTAAEVIEALGNRKIPFLKAMARVQSLTKDLGTYFIRYDEKKKRHVGMLTMVQLDSIVHHMLNHTSTVTGRLSSSNPNLQNLSKGNKSDVKLIFESRWGEDGVIIQSDFSSLEVYVQAILTKAANLIKDLQAGVDMHCMRLAAKEQMEYEEVYRLCKIIVDKEWDYKRTGTKEFSFQRAYGAGVAAIVESTGMSEEDVKALIAAEDARYPEVKQYFDAKAEEIKKTRVPIGLTVQHPDVPGLSVQLGKGTSRTPDGKLYVYKESCSPKFMVDRGVVRSFMPTEIKNYEVQGTGGEIAKAGMWLTVRAFYWYKCFEMLALLVNQVHDAEYADAHKKVAVKAAALLHACMAEASNFFSWFLQWPIPLPVPTDTVWGSNMGTEEKIEDPNFEIAVSKLRPWLRKQFMNGYEPTFTH
jgi:DNA polymerase I